MIATWRRAWGESIPFLDYPIEIRELSYTTNGIRSLNGRFRAATRRREHFPDEDSAMNVLPDRPRTMAQPGEPHRPDQRLEVHP